MSASRALVMPSWRVKISQSPHNQWKIEIFSITNRVSPLDKINILFHVNIIFLKKFIYQSKIWISNLWKKSKPLVANESSLLVTKQQYSKQ